MINFRRTQIYLDINDMADLKKESLRMESSVSEVIRVAVKEYLERKKNNKQWLDDPLTKVIGLAKSKKKNLSEKHDEVLYDD